MQMVDHALRLRDDVRSELLRSFSGLRCFVRIAPVDSPWLLVSDAPRQVMEEALQHQVETWSMPFAIENGLLYLDAPVHAYERALEIKPRLRAGPYHAEYERLQATAMLLLRHPLDAPALDQARPLLRESWRAFALGDAQVRLWADELRTALACGLREREVSGLFACGELLAAWLEQKGIPVPLGCPAKWEE